MLARKIGKGFFEQGVKATAFLLESGEIGLTDAPMWDAKTGQFLRVPKDRIFTSKVDEFFFNLFHYRTWYLFLENGIYYARYSDGRREK